MVNDIVNSSEASPPLDSLDAVFAALASAHRRRMVDFLSLQPSPISALAERIGMSLPAIDRHVRLLESSGLVRRKKIGRTNLLALDRATMRRVQEWASQYRADWGTDDESLENYAPIGEKKDR